MKQKKTHCATGPYCIAPKTLFAFLVAGLLLSGCQKEVTPGAEEDSAALVSNAKKKTSVMQVNPGSSIQAVINMAVAGTVIKIKPGTYTERLVVDKPGITLLGEGNVVIKNPGEVPIGITVKEGSNGFVLQGVTVSGFMERGVEIKNVEGFSLLQVKAIGKGEFGLFAQYSSKGTIQHCEATGHTDSGIFVGESTDVLVSQNKTFGNTIGIETENASHITIEKNHVYNNTAGILCLLVPHPSGILQSANIIISKNQVRENNLANLQTGGNELEAILPSGIGILILGVNDMLVQDNHVMNHKFTGIALISTAILGQLAGLPPEAFAGIDPNPDGAKVLENKLKNNGFSPPSTLPLPGVDLLWDGTGLGNCWSKNLYNTSYPQVLPACQ
jgi:parallel beta-helix repeat protein